MTPPGISPGNPGAPHVSLRTLVQALGLTPQRVAEGIRERSGIDVGVRHIDRVIRGEKRPSPELRAALLSVLHVQQDEVFGLPITADADVDSAASA